MEQFSKMRTPTEKEVSRLAQLKRILAAGKSEMLAIEQVSQFGEQFQGKLTKEALEEWGEITFVVPSPYTARNSFGKFYLNSKGEISVK